MILLTATPGSEWDLAGERAPAACARHSYKKPFCQAEPGQNELCCSPRVLTSLGRREGIHVEWGMCCAGVEGRKARADVRLPLLTWGCPGCTGSSGAGAAQPGCVSAPGLVMGSIRMCLCSSSAGMPRAYSGNPHLRAESTKPKAGVGQSCLKKGWAAPRKV